jgi:NAD dependent epimerase/dehydratase family enzyme
MKPPIVIAGGSGFLGSVLADFFAAKGMEVVIFARNPKARTGLIREVRWDGTTPGDWTQELEGARALINLAGVSVNCRYHAPNRKLMLDSRLESTRVLGEAIVRCANPPPVWLNSSTATIYKHNFGAAWDEAGEIGGCAEAKDIFSVHVATEWEREFFQSRGGGRQEIQRLVKPGRAGFHRIPLSREEIGDAVERVPTMRGGSQSGTDAERACGDQSLLASAATGTVRKVALRSAMVLGHATNSVLPNLLRLGRFGLGGSLAGGRQFVSWIHEEDFCRAVEWILENEDLSGPVNLASPNPVTNAEFMATIRKVCHAPFGLPATRWMLEIGAFFLRTETELLIKSRRVVPGKLLADGFNFRHPKLLPAIEQLVA